MIAAKIEEIYPPCNQKYLNICDNAYTMEELLKMESEILIALNFNLNTPTLYSLLSLLNCEMNLNKIHFYLALYILENSLLEPNIYKHSLYVITLASVYIVTKIYGFKELEASIISKAGNFVDEVKSCGKELFIIMKRNEKISLKAMKKQFSTVELCQVSRYRLEQGN